MTYLRDIAVGLVAVFLLLGSGNSARAASAPRHSIPSWSDVDNQPPPPLPTLLRALAWWHAQGHAPPPPHLIRHLPTFIPLYLSYQAMSDSKNFMSFEAWLVFNGPDDVALCDCLSELYRLAEAGS